MELDELDLDDIDYSVARFLYSRAFLEAAGECGVDAGAHLASLCKQHAQDVFLYPDGTVELQGKSALETFEREIGIHVRQRAMDITLAIEMARRRPVHLLMLGQKGFQSLWCLPPRRLYSLIFWGDFVEKLPDGHFGVYSAMDPFGKPDPNSAIDNVPVTVGFKTRIDPMLAKRLVELVVRWVNGGGIAGEGRARLLSSELEVADRISRFRIDLSASGQKTVNWLILQLLHLNDQNPVVDIYFLSRPHPDLTFEEEFQLLGPEVVRYSVKLSA
jgi:hypothetical protein